MAAKGRPLKDGEPRKTISLRLPESSAKSLRDIAALWEVSQADVVAKLLKPLDPHLILSSENGRVTPPKEKAKNRVL